MRDITDEGAVSRAVLAEVEAERDAARDALRQQLVDRDNTVGRRQRARRWLAAALVLITCTTFTAATTGIWARRNLLDTPRFEQRVVPLANDAVMKEALSRTISAQVIQAVDPKRLVADALPERGQILVAPISAAVESFIRSRVDKFVDSERFDMLWASTTEQAHRAAVALLRGEESQFASARDGTVTLNLVPIINALLADIGNQSPELLGHNVNLPTLTVNDLPDAAVRRLESALGIDLEDGYGEITVFKSSELSTIQDLVKLFDRLTVLLVLATLALIPLTLWVSPRRRRTLLQLAVGIAIGLVLVRRTGFSVEDQVLALVKVEANHGAVQLMLGAFVDPLRAACAWMLSGLAVIAALAVLSGPYPWAARLRALVADVARGSTPTGGARPRGRPGGW